MTWPVVQFADVARVEHGWPFRSEFYVSTAEPGSPRVVSIGNFAYEGSLQGTFKGYDGEYPREYELAAGDLLLVMTCQTAGGEILGLPALVPADGHTYLHNQRIGKVVVDKRLADTRFLHYVALTEEFNRQLFLSASGTKILHTSPGRIGQAMIPAPPLPTQRAIAEVLGALDDKIAANAAVVQGCDQLRRLKYEALVGPEVPLSSLARFVNGRAYTKGATGSGRVVIRIAELNSGLGGSTVYNDIEVPEDNLAREGDLLFAWSGSLTVARWYRPEAIVNQHIFKVVPLGDWPTWLVASATERKLEDFKAIAADKATTMGHIQRHHLDQVVGVPSWRVIATSHEAMQSLWDRALAAEVESLRLAELRDTLLPHLMSGRLTVREAEKQVEEVL